MRWAKQEGFIKLPSSCLIMTEDKKSVYFLSFALQLFPSLGGDTFTTLTMVSAIFKMDSFASRKLVSGLSSALQLLLPIMLLCHADSFQVCRAKYFPR